MHSRPKGRRPQKLPQFHPRPRGRAEANRKADSWLEDGICNTSARFSTVYAEYLESVKASSGTSNYQQRVKYGEYYLIPICKNTRIGDLSEGRLQDVLDRAYKSGCLKKDRKRPPTGRPLSRKTLGNLLSIERSFVKWCNTRKYTNLTTDNLHVPKGAQLVGKRILQPDSLRTLFSVDTVSRWGVVEHDIYIYAYRFAVSTGCRPGEIVGLWYGDIKGDRVDLSRSVNLQQETTTGKNDNARRSFIMNAQARQSYENQVQQLCDLGVELQYNTPLFMLRSERSFYNYWKAYQRSNGLPGISLYEMRHTFVSINGNMGDGHLRKLIGHSKNMDSHGTYDHLLRGELEEIADESTSFFDKVLC